MPRYFFNIVDGTSDRDLMGTELPDVHAAQAQAIRTGGEILRDMGAKLRDEADWKLEVADERGRVLFVLHVSAEELLPLPGSETDLQLGSLPGSPPGPAPDSVRD